MPLSAEPLEDDDLNTATASPEDVAYECGWHDGCDYGYRLAILEAKTLKEFYEAAEL